MSVESTPATAPRATASFFEAVRIAFDSLRSSKLRSFLTLLGIILATTTLIAVMSVIHSMDLYIAQNVSDMGADGFRIVRMAFIGDWDPKKFLELQRKNPFLKKEEHQFLKERTTLVRDIGMQNFRRGNAMFGGDKLEGIQIRGCTANMGAITNTQIEQGRYLTETENEHHLTAALIGFDLKEAFFPQADPVGKTIRVDGRPFEVVGVAKKQGSVFGQSLDSFVMIPIETSFKIHGSRNDVGYMAVARHQNLIFQAQDEIRMLMRPWRHVPPGADDNFAIVSSDSLMSAWGKMTGAIAATAIAVVSLFMVVGGVVIMNIMLAVVTERTPKIGIRKSVGARSRDILYQFLVESASLSATGGLVGVAIAGIIGFLVSVFPPVPMAMPASRAAKLDPIEALRVEK
ncbi:MAG: FtsX-like permease family protein [Acidobacteria bacterium]|nr:FtsX-like permease family protein [Acidobacteriota bacterium]